jgi:ligand-binding SRPBCC domain-containing protein
MRRGATIDYSLTVRGVPIRWKSLIVDWQPGVRFVDYQVRGPYELWRHEHRFAAVPEGTLVSDRVDYSLPLAPLSGPALPLVRADLARIFAFRRAAVLKET